MRVLDDLSPIENGMNRRRINRGSSAGTDVFRKARCAWKKQLQPAAAIEIVMKWKRPVVGRQGGGRLGGWGRVDGHESERRCPCHVSPRFNWIFEPVTAITGTCDSNDAIHRLARSIMRCIRVRIRFDKLERPPPPRPGAPSYLRLTGALGEERGAASRPETDVSGTTNNWPTAKLRGVHALDVISI